MGVGGGGDQGGSRAEGAPLSPPARSAASLSPKQRRFVAEYLKDCNATQAAIRAGYSAKTAHSAGPRMLGNVGVALEIQKGQAKHLDSAIATRAERQKFWTDVMTGMVDADMRDRLKASELLGKSEADFTEKVEHKGGIQVTRIERVVVDPGQR